MQIVKLDKKNNYFEVIPDSFDDLWHLEKLVEKGDFVSGMTERKIKPKIEGDKPFKEIVFVEVEVEKAIFHETSNQLRVQGVVTQSKPEELVPLKSHHTIEAEVGRKISVRKKFLKGFHLERLSRAKDATGREKILLIVMDDEGADFAFLKDSGLEHKLRLNTQREGKMYKHEKGKIDPYFDEIIEKIPSMGARNAVVAGPGFERHNFEKFIKGKKITVHISFESTNSVGMTGLNELVKGGKIDKLVKDFHAAQEAKSLERLLAALGNDMAAVGISEVNAALESNAVDELIINEDMLSENREKAEVALDVAERSGAKIVFVSSRSDAGRQIQGLGSIAAVLRYKKKW